MCIAPIKYNFKFTASLQLRIYFLFFSSLDSKVYLLGLVSEPLYAATLVCGHQCLPYSWNVKILTVTMGCIGQIPAPKDQASFQEIGRIPPSELCDYGS